MEFHCAALSVKWKPLHLEVAQPFHSVGDLKTDHVRRPVKKVGVVKESFLSVFVAEVGIGNHPPYLFIVCLAVFVSVFDVLIHRPRLPKQTSIFWIYDVELFIPLKVLKCDLLIDPLSSHLNSAPEKSVPFVDFNNVPDVYCYKNLVFCFILQRRRDQREWVFEVREVNSEERKLSLFFVKCKVKIKCFHSFSRSAKLR